MQLIDVTDSNFNEEVIKADIPVLVVFSADWCTFCKMVAPIVEELADEFDDRVKFAKLDVDSNPQSPSSYGIRGIPTMLIFDQGKPVITVFGAVAKSALKTRLETVDSVKRRP